jgi:hypothetical protein
VAPVIPEWLQTALLTVLLAYVASKTLAKGQKQFQKERSSVQTAPQQPAVQCVPSSHVVACSTTAMHPATALWTASCDHILHSHECRKWAGVTSCHCQHVHGPVAASGMPRSWALCCTRTAGHQALWEEKCLFAEHNALCHMCRRDTRGSMEPLLGGSIGHRASLEGGRTAADIAMNAAEAAAAEAAADDNTEQAPFLARVPWAKVGRLASNTQVLAVICSQQMLKHRSLHPAWALGFGAPAGDKKASGQ